jgi:hypothetical protein
MTMTQLVDVKVKDQYSQTYNVKAQLRQVPENSEAERLDLFKRIEHIVVDGEVILPSIELLFESRQTENKDAKVENGILADVAPSILKIMGMPQPSDMTGKALF